MPAWRPWTRVRSETMAALSPWRRAERTMPSSDHSIMGSQYGVSSWQRQACCRPKVVAGGLQNIALPLREGLREGLAPAGAKRVLGALSRATPPLLSPPAGGGEYIQYSAAWLRHCGCDRSDDAVEVVEDLLVREAKDAEALAFEPGCPGLVLVNSCFMRGAVDLDDQAGRQADEVNDVAAEAVLAAEAAVAELLAAELLPELALGVGLVLAQELDLSIHPRTLQRMVVGVIGACRRRPPPL